MRKRDITRIQYKLHDLKEYEAMKAAKLKESREKTGSTVMATPPPVPKTKSEMINQRIGLTAAAAVASANAPEPMD